MESLAQHRRQRTALNIFTKLAAYNLEQLKEAAQILHDIMDEREGDPDLEDATDLEDDFSIYTLDLDAGAGCPISDPSAQCDEDELDTGMEATRCGPGCLIADNDFEHDGREQEEGYACRYGAAQTRSLGPGHEGG